MEHHLTRLVLLTTTLGGCSKLYDPDRLPAAIDAAPPPLVCEALVLERVSPAELLEGQGDGGSRPAVLIIHGQNLVAGAKVSLTAHDQAGTPPVVVDPTMMAVDRSGRTMAVPVTAMVAPNLGAASSIRLDVVVTQPCEATGGTAEASLKELDGGAPALTLKGLGELTGMQSVPTTGPNLYSRVDATRITAADTARPLIIRSTSSITIRGTQPVSVNATNQTPGPGGFAGGNGGPPGVVGGAGDGAEGSGPGGGRPNGGGGGFAEMGKMGSGTNAGPGGPIAGDASLITLESPNRGSGGAGGRGAALVGGPSGGAGGGGGGTLELTAGGDLTVTVPIEAKGGNGSMTGASSGGGGSGGVVLLRAGRNLAVGDATNGVKATGGPPGGNGTDAGAGAFGRVRVDAPSRTLTLVSDPPVAHRGPMFAGTTPLIIGEARPRITLFGEPSARVKYTIEDDEGTTRGPMELTLSSTGETTAPLGLDLFVGYNTICAIVTGVINRRGEAENCISVAYIRSE